MTVTLYPGMDLTVQAAFGIAPLNTTPIWQDISAYAMSIDIKRGRTDEFSQYSPGTATITLNNSTRIFDPYFSTGLYYGYLVPMTPIRVLGNGQEVFNGFVTAWPSDYDISNNLSISTIPCVDAMRFFSNSYLTSSAFGKLVLSDSSLMNFYPMQVIEPIGITCSKTNTVLALNSTGAGADAVPSNYPAGATTMLAPGQNYSILNSQWDNQSATTAEPRSVEFWIDKRAQKNTSTIVEVIRAVSSAGVSGSNIDQFTVSVASNGNITTTYSNVAANKSQSTVAVINAYVNVGANHVAVTTDNTNIYTYVNGTLANTTAITGLSATGFYNRPQTVTASTGLSNVAIYNAQLSAGTVLARYTAGVGYPNETTSARLTKLCNDIGWPFARRNFAAGVQAVGSYRPVGQAASGYMRQLENAEQGAIFVRKDGSLQFKNRTTTSDSIVSTAIISDEIGSSYPFTNIEIDANDLEKIFNNIVATYENGQTTQTDSTSVTAYGPQIQQIDLALMSTRADADAAAAALLAKYKNPTLTIESLTLDTRSATLLTSFVLGLELTQDYIVRFQPMKTGTVYWRALRIQGISHNIRPQQWTTTLYFSPGSTNVNGPLFILNNATYGLLDGTQVLG